MLLFFFWKILDPPKKDVSSLTVSTVGDDTQTMRLLMEDDIPLGGECITLLYSMQVIAFNKNDIAHEQTIICRQLFAGRVVGFWPMKR